MMNNSTATTFTVSDKKPSKVHTDSWGITSNMSNPDETHENAIKNLRQFRENNCTEILQKSNFPTRSMFTKNGFVTTVLHCYNGHHNLILRPDDVWAAIMTQFSFYINKHAEEFRRQFVNFEGKKVLSVSIGGSLRNAPYDTFVKLMTKEIDRNLVDPEVKKWILPSFSTTTDNDLVTVGVVFMASMKKYFHYACWLMCGIPSVTLEGTLEDWKNVHKRLEKLKDYKLEKWYDMLEPILQQFVNSKEGKVDLDFWSRVCSYYGGGSGPTYLSGWITAFCVFTTEGDCIGGAQTWPRLETENIPTGSVEVDVKIIDNGAEYDSVMFAGHMAAEIKEDECTMQPTLGWTISLKSPVDEN